MHIEIGRYIYRKMLCIWHQIWIQLTKVSVYHLAHSTLILDAEKNDKIAEQKLRIAKKKHAKTKHEKPN